MEELKYGREIAASLLDTLGREVALEVDTDLLDLGLDSINFVRLIVLLEERLSIRIADDDVLLAHFSTPARIDQLLNRYAKQAQ
ncbi:phosphopantetheine-binding protein [Brevibacillus humidisoli]|uniref:phosphopantetheine-binding protein n=1 Tax=Brevibacillus humidisoli TaxID=2895522 RepID=UPI001E547E34|nr:phosphopantetheine-binding protein [Brevibacillus humidisoli]UFJ42465.1 phosphopantetheine-binding protein [Brevibacillus humidisoli]